MSKDRATLEAPFPGRVKSWTRGTQGARNRSPADRDQGRPLLLPRFRNTDGKGTAEVRRGDDGRGPFPSAHPRHSTPFTRCLPSRSTGPSLSTLILMRNGRVPRRRARGLPRRPARGAEPGQGGWGSDQVPGGRGAGGDRVCRDRLCPVPCPEHALRAQGPAAGHRRWAYGAGGALLSPDGAQRARGRRKQVGPGTFKMQKPGAPPRATPSPSYVDFPETCMRSKKFHFFSQRFSAFNRDSPAMGTRFASEPVHGVK